MCLRSMRLLRRLGSDVGTETRKFQSFLFYCHKTDVNWAGITRALLPHLVDAINRIGNPSSYEELSSLKEFAKQVSIPHNRNVIIGVRFWNGKKITERKLEIDNYIE